MFFNWQVFFTQVCGGWLYITQNRTGLLKTQSGPVYCSCAYYNIIYDGQFALTSSAEVNSAIDLPFLFLFKYLHVPYPNDDSLEFPFGFLLFWISFRVLSIFKSKRCCILRTNASIYIYIIYISYILWLRVWSIHQSCFCRRFQDQQFTKIHIAHIIYMLSRRRYYFIIFRWLVLRMQFWIRKSTAMMHHATGALVYS